jgi:hypothetical protein
MILETDPTLSERIDEGKWFGGMLVYDAPSGFFLFALGARAAGKSTFHMMPYYGSKELQSKYGPSLKKVLSGKSCALFTTVDEPLLETFRAIVEAGAGPVRQKMEEMWLKRKK